MNRYAIQLVKAKQSEEALPIVKRLVDALPDDVSPMGGLTLLTAVYRDLEQEDNLYQALQQLQKMSPDCLDELMMLIEMDKKKNDSHR